MTGHRRENFGAGFENICLALREIVELIRRYTWYLSGPSESPMCSGRSTRSWASRIARVREPAAPSSGDPGGGRLSLLPPLDYAPFVFLMSSKLSGLDRFRGHSGRGPGPGETGLVMREVTERPEGVWAGTVKLVGTTRETILAEVKELLENPATIRPWPRPKTLMATATLPRGLWQSWVNN